MKRLLTYTLVMAGFVLAMTGCSDELLVENPNAPTPAVLRTEEGLRRASTGLYSALEGGGFFPWIVWNIHEGMGDAIPTSVGNWGLVDMVNPDLIKFSDGTEQHPYEARGGPKQRDFIEIRNDRTASDPTLNYEWRTMYQVNNEANLVLSVVDDPAVKLSGNAEAKRNGYKAWAYFWKGYAYGRIGLLYEQGLVTSEYGETNNNYMSPAQMLAASNENFDLAIQHAAGFSEIAEAVVPSQFGVKPTGASLAQAANTLKARNVLMGKYRSDLSAADWQQIETLTAAGLMSNDNTVQVKFDQNTYGGTGQLLYRAGPALGPSWAYVSERIVQEFVPGDARFQDVGETDPNAYVAMAANPAYPGLKRGFNHITQARGRPPVFEANVGDSQLYIVSAEENMLMAAEAKLALGKAGEAAGLVDQVRTMQGAGLPSLGGTVDFETIRRERRVALLARGLAYYDARRLKISIPVEQGGTGRTGARVYKEVGTDLVLDTNATIFYNFRPYWPVPAHETDFNPPGGASLPN